MEELNLMKMDDAGQLYFDFDSLESLTSAEFVCAVVSFMERQNITNSNSVSKKECEIKSVIKAKYYLECVVHTGYLLAVYGSEFDTSEFDVHYFTLSDLGVYASAFGYEIVRKSIH